MQRLRSFHFKTLLGILIFSSGLTLFSLIACGPNQELHFTREVKSKLDPTRLDRNLSSTTRWPQWFYSLSEVQSPGAPLPKVEKGSILELQMDPKKGQSKKFKLTAEVTEYRPGELIQLKILDDSTGKLTRLFDTLEWKVEFLPNDQGSLIRGTAKAHTRHWRSRFFGRIAERILMNQVFYPNLIKLSELRQPFSVEVPEPARSY